MNPRRPLFPTLGLLLLLAACGAPTGTATPIPTPTPGSTDAVSSPTPPGSPSASESPAADWAEPVIDPPPGLIPSGSQARVAVDSLNLRREPSLSAPVDAVLSGGDLVRVIDGPRSVEGFEWYNVFLETGPGSGWTAAAGADGTPFLVYEPPRCPIIGPDDLVTAEIFVELAGWPALACFGDRQIRFTGTITCRGHGGYLFAEPAWLGGMAPAASDLDGWIGGLHYDPALAEVPECWSVIDGTGQFDHPAAQTCEDVPPSPMEDPRPPRTKAEVVLLCREQFVVQGFTVVAQPSPPPGWEPPPSPTGG